MATNNDLWKVKRHLDSMPCIGFTRQDLEDDIDGGVFDWLLGPRPKPTVSWWRKLLTTVLLLLLAADTHGAERLVRTFLATSAYEPAIFTGGTISGPQIRTLLFLNEPCPLNIVGAEHMHRAWQIAGAYQVGCWYPTLQDEYTYINGAGQLFHSEGVYWQAYARGVLHADGTVTITEPGFDSRTFFSDVGQRITMEHLRGLEREAP